MPFVKSENALSPDFQGVAVDKSQNEEIPDFFRETVPAAFRLENVIGSAGSEEAGLPQSSRISGIRSIDTEFNPFSGDNISGYEQYETRFADVMNENENSALKRQIDREMADREVISQSGKLGFVASIGAGTLDPTLFVPVGGQLKKGESLLNAGFYYGKAAAAGAVVSEGILHTTQETRTAGESAAAITAGTFLGGILGVGGTAAMRKIKGEDVFGGIAKKLEDDLTLKDSDMASEAPQEGELVSDGSIGAAQVIKPVTSLEDEAIAGTGKVADIQSWLRLNPELRTAFSPSARVRETKNRLISSGLKLERNKNGVRSYTAIEDIVETYKGDVQKAYSVMDAQYKASRELAGQDTGAIGAAKRFVNPRAPREFREEVAKAMRRGDVHSDPHVQASAKALRPLYDKLRDQAIEVGILPEGVRVRTADSYLHRMWNQREIVAREGEFKERLSAHIKGQVERNIRSNEADPNLVSVYEIEGQDYIDEIVQGVVDKLRGLDQRELPGDFVVAERGPLKDRTLNVKDIDFEDFLVNDIEVITNRYTRLAATDIHLTREFGDPTMEKAIREIREEYQELAEQAKNAKERDKVAKRLKRDIKDIEGMRDVVRGNYSKHDPENSWVRMAETAKQWNFTRLLGGMTISAFPDTARHVMSHGFGNIASELFGPLVKNLDAVKLQVKDARLAGAVTEKVLNTRVATFAEINDPTGTGTPFQNFMDNVVAGFSRATLMTQWNDIQKSATSIITMNRINRVIKTGGKGKDKEFLAFIGLDETNLPAIEKQMKKYGRVVDGVQVANLEDWTDEVAAIAYKAALVKEAKSTIVTRGAGDVPLAMNTPTGQVIGQFKTFLLAANQRVMLRGLQDRDTAVLSGMMTMITMGMMVYYFKSVNSGREPDMSFNKLMVEGIDRSGLIPVLFEANNIVEKAGVPGFMFLAGGEQASRYQSRGVAGAFLGPSVDLIDQTFRATRGIANEGLKDTDIGTIRKLMPYNNLFYVRWLFDQLELAAGDVFGADEGRRTDQLER